MDQGNSQNLRIENSTMDFFLILKNKTTHIHRQLLKNHYPKIRFSSIIIFSQADLASDFHCQSSSLSSRLIIFLRWMMRSISDSIPTNVDYIFCKMFHRHRVKFMETQSIRRSQESYHNQKIFKVKTFAKPKPFKAKTFQNQNF